MRIIVLGDIHGNPLWKQVVEKEQDSTDLFLFIGDYFDSFQIKTDDQCNNFLDIIAYKQANMEKVILLIGNHDHHYIVGNTGTSGFQEIGQFQISPILKDNLKYLQAAYQHDKLLFTHAGISEEFLLNTFGYDGWTNDDIVEQLNNLMLYKPQSFCFSGYNSYGDDEQQTPIWIRPKSLMRASQNLKKDGYIQIVGHTGQNQIDINGKATGGKYWFIDTLNSNREYLIIEDGVFKSGKI